jgi:hypothetical protein
MKIVPIEFQRLKRQAKALAKRRLIAKYKAGALAVFNVI